MVDSLLSVAVLGSVSYLCFDRARRRSSLGHGELLGLTVGHFGGTIAFAWVMTYLYSRQADAFVYLTEARSLDLLEFRQPLLGTNFVTNAVNIADSILPANLLSLGSLFAVPSFFARVRLAELSNHRWLRIYILFSPVVSFFNTAVGKDSIAFFGLTWLTTATRRREAALGFVAILAVRPHIALVALPLLALSPREHENGSDFQSRALIAGMLVLTVPTALGFVQQNLLQEANFDSIEARLDLNESALTTGTTAPDTYADLPLVARMILTPARPFPIGGPLQLAGFVDSILLAAVALRPMLSLRPTRRALAIAVPVFALLLFFSFTPNEGLVLRQKTMLVPLLCSLLERPPAGDGKRSASTQGNEVSLCT